MKYKLTDKAKQSPLLVPLPFYPHENVGVGGNYEVNTGARCASCSPQEQAAFEKENAGKPKRFFREAEPHEYEAIAEAYKASNGIPGYLIIIPDEPKPQVQPAEKDKK